MTPCGSAAWAEPTLRGSRLGDPRFRASGLTASDADAFLPPLLKYAEGPPRTAAELRTWLEEHLGTTAPDSGAHRMLRHYAPLWHAPTGGPWSFDTRQSYVAASPRPALTDPDAATDGLRMLIRRYLQGFGPASVADMAQFALVQQGRIKKALQPMSEELEVLPAPDGRRVLYDLPGAPPVHPRTPPPHLASRPCGTALSSPTPIEAESSHPSTARTSPA